MTPALAGDAVLFVAIAAAAGLSRKCAHGRPCEQSEVISPKFAVGWKRPTPA